MAYMYTGAPMYPYLGTLPTFPSGSLPQYTTTYGHPAPFPAAAPMTVLPSDPLKYPLQSSYQQSTYTPASYTYQPTLQSSVPPQAPTQGPPSAPQPVTPRATATTPRPKEEVAAAVAEVAAAAQASQERHQASTPRPPADSEPAAPHSDDDSAWDVPKPTAEEPAQGQDPESLVALRDKLQRSQDTEVLLQSELTAAAAEIQRLQQKETDYKTQLKDLKKRIPAVAMGAPAKATAGAVPDTGNAGKPPKIKSPRAAPGAGPKAGPTPASGPGSASAAPSPAVAKRQTPNCGAAAGGGKSADAGRRMTPPAARRVQSPAGPRSGKATDSPARPPKHADSPARTQPPKGLESPGRSRPPKRTESPGGALATKRLQSPNRARAPQTSSVQPSGLRKASADVPAHGAKKPGSPSATRGRPSPARTRPAEAADGQAPAARAKVPVPAPAPASKAQASAPKAPAPAPASKARTPAPTPDKTAPAAKASTAAADKRAPAAKESSAAPVASVPGPAADRAPAAPRVSFGIEPVEVAVDGRITVVAKSVIPLGAADEAGLVPGDVLVTWEGTAIDSKRTFAACARATAPGDIVVMTVDRTNADGSVQPRVLAIKPDVVPSSPSKPAAAAAAAAAKGASRAEPDPAVRLTPEQRLAQLRGIAAAEGH